MQRTLQEHIAFLEERIAKLEAQAVDLSRTAAERYQSSVDLATPKARSSTSEKPMNSNRKFRNGFQTDPLPSIPRIPDL